MTRKSSVAQSEILIGLLFLTLFSGAVIAQNATNITNFTGNFLTNLSDLENTTEPETPTFTVEATKTYEVWANSAIALPLTKTSFYDNETIEIFVSLLLDNGTQLTNSEIEFFLDNNLIGSNFTDPSGETTFDIVLSNTEPGSYILSVVFSGGEYINPSQEQILIHVMRTNTSIKVNEKLGHLEIIVFNISEGFYKTFEFDEEYERIEKKYYKVYVEAFNNFSRVPGVYTLEDNEVIEVFLEDGLGNSYEQDDDILFFLGPLNLFGNSVEITPSTSRKGYLIFSETRGTPEKLIFKIKSGSAVEFGLR